MKYFYAYIIPIAWLVNTTILFYHPGDEYGMFFFTSIAGSWPFIFFGISVGHPSETVPWILVTGGGILVGLGYLMDRLELNKIIWSASFVLCSGLLLAWSLLSYDSYHDAMQKNGSLTAYITASCNIGIYCSILLAFVAEG